MRDENSILFLHLITIKQQKKMSNIAMNNWKKHQEYYEEHFRILKKCVWSLELYFRWIATNLKLTETVIFVFLWLLNKTKRKINKFPPPPPFPQLDYIFYLRQLPLVLIIREQGFRSKSCSRTGKKRITVKPTFLASLGIRSIAFKVFENER